MSITRRREGGCEEREEVMHFLRGGEVVDSVVEEGGEVEGGFPLDGGWL
jgi:hypothetical protein